MATFDFHAHVYAADIAEKLISRMEEIYGVKRAHNAVVEDVLESAAAAGIDRIVVLSVANRPEHIRFNDWYAELGKKYDNIIPFGSIHIENDPSELDRFPKLGLKGIKIQPNAQKFYPDDVRMFPIYERASKLGLIVSFHCGDEQGGVKGVFSHPKNFVKIVRSFPDLKIVLNHFGGYMQWEHIDPLIGFENVYFDTAFLPRMIDDALFISLAERIGFDHIIFGTDFPFKDHKAEREYIEHLFGNDLARKFMSGNPSRLLGL
ncbi:MAG: amidohydrolase [Firmicutes bacterium]|nr:amidohydrolase [Bacillota bacterium]